jgi:hypothetical protein
MIDVRGKKEAMRQTIPVIDKVFPETFRIVSDWVMQLIISSEL